MLFGYDRPGKDFLGREMEVEGTFGDFGLVGHLAQGGAAVAVLLKNRGCPRENGIARGLGPVLQISDGGSFAMDFPPGSKVDAK